METSYDHEYHDLSLKSAAELRKDLNFQLSLTEEKREDAHDEDEEEEEKEEGEFSFMCGGGNASPIAAEDAFANGQIKPIFPIINTDLLLGEGSQVKKVFVEVKNDEEEEDDEDDDGHVTMFTTTSSSSTGNDEISGPCCEWSKEPSASPEVCKKSNSTGFSKLWRFRDLLHRSNSDGRDAFVFLKNQPTTSSVAKKEEKKAGKEEVKVNDGKGKVKKGGKSKQKKLSPHEIYMRSKAKDDDRRRSYLPYRPEVFGFFTNVNGGMSRNVHPF